MDHDPKSVSKGNIDEPLDCEGLLLLLKFVNIGLHDVYWLSWKSQLPKLPQFYANQLFPVQHSPEQHFLNMQNYPIMNQAAKFLTEKLLSAVKHPAKGVELDHQSYEFILKGLLVVSGHMNTYIHELHAGTESIPGRIKSFILALKHNENARSSAVHSRS